MRKEKRVEDSVTEISRLLQYEDINGENRLFGGRLMAWIDEAAGITAIRHCGGSITTAAVDNLVFKYGAVLNDLIVLKAKLTYVGRTSMEVRVDTYIEDRKTGIRRLINHAYLTEVHLDENGKPKEIPYGLKVETEIEKIEWEGALKRRSVRRERRTEGF